MKPQRYSERKKIMILYVAFFGTLAMSCFTPPKIAVLSLMACVIVLAFIYSMRVDATKNSLLENHATYLIRTFWRTNLYMGYSLIFALAFLVLFIDYAALKPCIFFVTHYWESMISNWDTEKYAALFEACGKTLSRANQIVFVTSGIIMLLPAVCYIIHRFYMGWRHAVRGLRINESRL